LKSHQLLANMSLSIAPQLRSTLTAEMREGIEEIISIPNAPRTFEAVSSSGYDLNAALADVIDNAVTHQVLASEVDVTFKVNGQQKIQCRIIDNGSGMSATTLEEAMRLGADSHYEEEDLGKFGMGMKSASLSQCDRLTVISKEKNGAPSGFRWDMGHVQDRNNWALLKLPLDYIKDILEQENVNIGGSGTLVIWDELVDIQTNYSGYRNRIYAEAYYIKLKKGINIHLGMVFHRFLEGTVTGYPKLTIKVNGTAVQPWDPFCRKEVATRQVKLTKNEANVSFAGRNNAIQLSGYVVPHKDQFSSPKAWAAAKGPFAGWNDSQGYYIYRANRIIRFGGWHHTRGKDEHIKLARIAIDIHPELDDLFQITVNKTKVKFPEELWTHLKSAVNPKVTGLARKLYGSAGKKEKVNNKVRVKNKQEVDTVSRSVLKEEGVTTSANSTDSGHVEVNNKQGQWNANTPVEFNLLGDRDAAFEVVSEPLESHLLWKVIAGDSNKLKVVVNSDHPFYDRVYRSKPNSTVTGAVDSLIVSLALAEISKRTDQNGLLFDSFKETVAASLQHMIEKDVL